MQCMNEKEYNRLKQQFEAEYRKKIEALEIIYQATRESKSESQTEKRERKPQEGTLTAAIKEALDVFTSHAFDINDVIKTVEGMHPEVKRPINPTSVSGALKKFERDGLLEIVQSGRGKRPHVYRNRHQEESADVTPDEALELEDAPF